jgi:hypothetical protein
MKTPVYKWSGKYWGFISNNKLFDQNATYCGWIDEDNRVWNTDGFFLGEVIDENYILRKNMKMQPMNKIPKMAPMQPMPPLPRMDRVGRISRLGWDDVLEIL